MIHSRGLCYIHPIANAVNVQNELGRLIVMHEVDPSSLGRYTGLHDIFVVKYEPAMFRLENRNRSFVLDDDGYSKYEVIGNIHDNADILKDSENL